MFGEGECGVGWTNGTVGRSFGDSPELGKMTARSGLGESGSLLELVWASGDAQGSLRSCGCLWFALEVREMVAEVCVEVKCK